MAFSDPTCRADPDPPVVEGYRVGRLIGRGGSADVWQSTRLADRTPVALKVLRARTDDRARRELRALLGRQWPHVVPCLDVTSTADERIVLVLGLLQGGTVASLVPARGHLTPGEAVTVVVPLLQGLAALHAAGLTHGDVSPGNVLLSAEGEPFLSDLGSATVVGETHQDLWATEGFVAPEVLAGHAPDPAADVYAVGALLWYCLVGHPPGVALARPPLADVDADIPEPVRALVEACLDEHPGRRPSAVLLGGDLCDVATPTAIDLRVADDALALITHRLRRQAPPPDPLAAALERAEELDAGGAAPWWRRRLRARRRPVALEDHRPRHGAASRKRRGNLGAGVVVPALLGGMLALLLGGAGWSLIRPGEPASATAPTRASSPSRPATPAASGVPSAGAMAGPSTASPRDAAVRQPDAPARRPSALLQELADARAAAYGSTSEAALRQVDAPGSAAWAHDAAALQRMRAAGVSYPGVHLRVRQAQASPVVDGRTRVTAVVATASYAVRRAGSVQRHPGDGGRPVVVHLRWGSGGWRVEQVTAT